MKDELREAAEIAGTRAFPAHPHFRGTGAALYIAGYEAGKPKWIPVSKLPDEEDDYLVQYGFNDDTGPFISTAEFFPEGDDPAGWLIHRTSSESAEVIAWMRLPDTEGE